MTVTVKLFAAARDAAGRESESESVSARTVAEVRTALAGQVPALAELLKRCAIAVNHQFADDAAVIQDGDEVAVIPPVSGG